MQPDTSKIVRAAPEVITLKRYTRMGVLGLVVIVGLLANSCESPPPIRESDDVFMQSRVETDPYRKTVWIISPTYDKWPGEDIDLYSYKALLRALVNEKSVTVYQFYISATYYRASGSFNRAFDITGRELDLVQIDRQVLSGERGKVQEDFAINLERDYLNRAKSGGLNIKAVGKSGDHIFVLPAFYVDGFLRKVDVYIGKQ